MDATTSNQAPADPARPADPALNPDLVGYQTPEQLAQAHRNLQADAKRRSEENQTLREQMTAFLQAAANPRQDVKQRGGTLDDRLNEAGIPAMDIRELAREVVKAEFEPIMKGIGARSTVLAQYPDYNKFESDVAQFIQSDPGLNQTYQRLFSADPVGAFEYAFLKFGESRRRSVNPGEAEQVTQEAAAHAGIPSSRNGEARRTVQNANNSIQRAWEQYQKTGTRRDAEAYARERLHTVITDEHLNT